MRKILILIAALTVIMITVAILYFSRLGVSARSNDKVLAHIPGNAALVAGFRNEHAFYDIFRQYDLFNAVLGPVRSDELAQLQQLLFSHPGIAEAAEGQNTFLSFQQEKSGTIGLLWLMALDSRTGKEDIAEMLLQPNANFRATSITVAGSPAFRLSLLSIKKDFYLFVDHGMVIGSFSQEILQQSLDTRQPKIAKDFLQEISAGSRQTENSPVNLFINHRSAPAFLSPIFRGKLNGNLALLSGFSGQTTLNLNYKSDALMFSGISKPDTAAMTYLGLFLHQDPVPVTLLQSFPATTANYLAFGTSNYPGFYLDLHRLLARRGELTRLDRQFDLLKNSQGFDIEQQLKPLIGNEFSVIELADQQKLGVIKLQNPGTLSTVLEQISTVYSTNIRQLNNANIPYYFFGDPLRIFARPYYTIVDNYLVIANTASTLGQFLNDYTSGSLLYKSAEFKKFNQFIANQANISVFIHTNNSRSVIQSSLKQQYAGTFSDPQYGLKNFYGWSWQWSGDGDHFFTNLYAGYTETASSSMELAWKYRLNAPLATVPQVFRGDSNSSFLVVQDKVNNLYAFSTGGQKRWAIQLNGRLAGPVSQLDDHSLLANTPTHLYRINADGSMLSGFPVKLPAIASYGLTVSSTDPVKALLFIPCGDLIAGYDVSGNPVTGWNKSTGGKLLFDLKTITIDGIGYLAGATDNGKFVAFTDAGQPVMNVQGPGVSGYSNPVVILPGTGLESTRIMTTDTAGTVIQVNFEGKVVKKSTGTWSSRHFFDARNIANDERNELIYLDKNQLYVYDADSSLLFNYEFGHNIINRAQFFPVGPLNWQLGVASAEDQLLYLFDDDGTGIKGFPVKGLPGFYAGPLGSGRSRYLVYGKNDNYLYVYKL